MRSVLLVTHTGRAVALAAGREVAKRLLSAGVDVRALAPEAAELDCDGVTAVESPDGAAAGVELVLVLGGDGTLLRGAEIARPAGAPMLGVNLGHVGFLAEAEEDDLHHVVDGVLARSYHVEERLTIDVTVAVDGTVAQTGWALNDVTLEKASRQRIIHVVAEVDDRPLMSFSCDGVVFATPTGSTAYAFSAGGPVVWPDVEALLMVPISAHALFARPIVVSPASALAAELSGGTAVLFCDGRRTIDLPDGGRVEVRRGGAPVRLARLRGASFTDRLVAKFQLPVTGWRGREGRGG